MRKPVTQHDEELLDRLIKYRVNGDKDRWSENIPHHSWSDNLVHDIAGIDWMFFGNSLDIKMGGDGDNGEILMYILDVLFDLYGEEKK